MYQLFISELHRIKKSSKKRADILLEDNYTNDLVKKFKWILFAFILMIVVVGFSLKYLK